VTSFQRHLALTVVLAGLAGFAGVWVGSTRIDRGTTHPAAPLRAAVDELTQRGLVGLTPEQKQKISELEARFSKTRGTLRTRIAGADMDLANALSQEMSYGPLAQDSIHRLQNDVGELQTQTVLYVLDVRAVLTPEQRVVFDEKVVAALMESR
jgi:hypothetical protein